MSSDALYRITETLRSRLETAINKAPTFNIGGPIQVLHGPPSVGGRRLALWLYQITEDEATRNAGNTITRDANKRMKIVPPPLRLNLHYLLTPMFDSVEQDLRVLGWTMRWFYDNAVVQLRLPDKIEEVLRISVDMTDIESLSRIWDALRQDYRLSVGYLVRTARIASEESTSAAPVVTVESDLAEQEGIEAPT